VLAKISAERTGPFKNPTTARPEIRGTSCGHRVGSRRIRGPHYPPTFTAHFVIVVDKAVLSSTPPGPKSAWGLTSSDGRTELHLAQLLTENGGN
jgi:hypothetical protein